jgi:hypothetical protein
MLMDAPEVASEDICTVVDVVGVAVLKAGETTIVLTTGLASLQGTESSAG